MDFFKTVDTFIYGRKSYEAMIAYWAELNDEFANVMNQTKKLVFFRTLKNVVWNSRLINTNSVEETCSLKKENFECNSSYASLPFLFLNCIFFEIILQLTVFLRG
jgi:dihydrofolate reductase